MLTFLLLPLELRLAVYETFLAQHQSVHQSQQPSNEHIRVLRTCTQIYHEASPIFARYISLLHERQIHAFLACPGVIQPSQVLWADVANDGRLLHTDKNSYPLSQLYLAMRMLSSLQHLRVFDCRQGLPISLHSMRSKQISLQFEQAMFAESSGRPSLYSYELFLNPHTRSKPFSMVASQSLRCLRLSGECHISADVKAMPHLRRLVLYGVTSNYFDRNNLQDCFFGAELTEFSYAVGAKNGFLIRDHHIRSLASGIGRNLRKLVLLGCSRLTSVALAECLGALSNLEYFALSMITVDELDVNFLALLPRTVSTLKFSITNAGYTMPFIAQERAICNTLEDDVFNRVPRLLRIAVDFRPLLMDEEGRRERWETILRHRRTPLYIGNWMQREDV
ncbi:unnamed protein product [Somion occarium]|uniref:Uncharacterized protein n=1 Tax=Somion occarium TaxID=3059160 RepID=A0ABP1CID2_9APHY